MNDCIFFNSRAASLHREQWINLEGDARMYVECTTDEPRVLVGHEMRVFLSLLFAQFN